MDKLLLRDGTSQDDRMLHALEKGYFNVDELRFEELLAMAAGHAGLLQFTNIHNQPAGDWQAFFDADEVGILASILAANFNWFSKETAQLIEAYRQQPDLFTGSNEKIADIPAVKLAVQIDSWLIRLGRLNSISAIRARDKIQNIIENVLNPELRQLLSGLRNNVEFDAELQPHLSQVWLQQEGRNGAAAGAATVQVEQLLRTSSYTFYHGALFLQRSVAEFLELSLGRSNHDPAMSMLLAFLKLFRRAQDKLNGFSQRHLQFYYEDVLKIRRRKFVPDSTFLIVAPDKPGREVLIEQGTEFKGGLDENNIELLYAADHQLLVSDAKVVALHTLYFERNELCSPENRLFEPASSGTSLRKQYATGAKLNHIELGDGTAAMQPLFGVPERSKNKDAFIDARIGFALGSNVLLLQRGQRDITFNFKLDKREDGGTLESFIENLARKLSEESSWKDDNPVSGADTFFKIFRHMFNISLTSESGWLNIAEYLPVCSITDADECEKNTFKIKLQLPDSAPAIVAYAEKLHGENFATELPLAKFVINPKSYFYCHSLLGNTPVREVVITVDVKGNTDVQLYNQSGPLDAAAQFNPFGPLPDAGDYLVVGNYEAARKKLDNFEVQFEWGKLPQEMNGFAEYYSAYDRPFTNELFQVSLSVLRERKWMPAETEQAKTRLFDAGDHSLDVKNDKLLKHRLISFRGLCSLSKPLANITEQQYSYDALSKDGFFKLALTQPAHAFGHKDYPLELSRVMTENAALQKHGLSKLLSKVVPPKPLPNPPYTPLVNAIAINYSASSTINLEGNAATAQESPGFFHLHPMGISKLEPQAFGKTRLVSPCDADGNLYIGLSATKLSGLLTLFFHLREDSLPEAGSREFKFAWHYLSSNQWVRFKPAQLISDTTNNFLCSGIVTLDIPDDINIANSVMPGDIYWIRVSVDSDSIYTLCSLYGVHAQALQVSWRKQNGNSLSHLATGLPAGTIKQARVSIPGIATLHQIVDSSGGQPPESARQQTMRVSERLRHKNRAVTAWDYERLILQAFPEIFKVKCLPCMTDDAKAPGAVKPGSLLVVLVPYLKDNASLNFRPMVNALLLKKVTEFIRGIASGMVEIKVRNPAYEQIQVRCTVKFRRGVAQGWAYNELTREIMNYLSPWGAEGIKVQFGWSIRCHDIQAYLQELDYVESLSGLSLLQIVEDDARRHHALFDTKRNNWDGVVPTLPWSIAIPTKQHLIRVADKSAIWDAQDSGITDLSIGSTFIISGSSNAQA